MPNNSLSTYLGTVSDTAGLNLHALRLQHHIIPAIPETRLGWDMAPTYFWTFLEHIIGLDTSIKLTLFRNRMHF